MTTTFLSTAKMEKFKAKVLKFANSDPINPLSPSQLTLIHHKLNLAFSDFRTPTHPTYSSMIQNAINKLNEEDGSKEELISEYIKEEYKSLPWAHDMYLSHHLTKLCENGEILYNSTSKCYTLPDWARSQEDKTRKKGRKRRLVRKRKESVTEDKEGNLGGEKLVEESGDMIGFQEDGIEEVEGLEDEEGNVSGSFGVEVSGSQEEDVEEFGRSKTKPRRRSLVFIEECDEGEQNAVVQRPDEKLAREDGDGDTSDAANLMRKTAECVDEAPINKIFSSVSNIRGENNCDLDVNTIQAESQEADLWKKQLKEQLERKRKGLVNEDLEGDLGGEKVVEVCENQIEFQKKNIEECGKGRAKPRGWSLVVAEDNDEVGRTTFDGEKQKLVVESYDEVSAQGDTSDAGKMMLVPSACVEESPISLISSSVTNIRCDNVPELAINKSALKERELMIVPYKGDTSICEVRAEINPIPDTKDKMIVCGLPSITENFQTKRLPACLKKRRQRKLKVSLETMPSLPALAVDCNLLEHNQLQELSLQRAIAPKVSEIEIEMGPLWLERMLKEQYYIRCSVHTDSVKHKRNRFCLDCMGDAFCLNCLPHHKDHRIVQIRKHSCRKVVKTHDIQQYIDISNIRTCESQYGEILYIDFGPQRSSKDATCCEICCSGRINSFRFCSLPCKLIAARLKSTKFLPIDQSQQAGTLSLLDGTSIEQLDKQKNFNASQFSSLEDPMSVEDEENLPLQKVLEKKVLEKCGKRKKQVEHKFTANSPLVTETANIIGSKLPLDVQTSDCSKHQINDQERQGQLNVVGFGDVEASISSIVQGDVPTSYQKREQEPKLSEATKDDAIGALDLHLQLPKGLDEPVTDLDSQKQTKQLKMDGLGKTTEERETSKEDVSDSSNLYAHEPKGLFEPATNQHSQQQIKPKDDAQGRPLEHLEEAKDDATFTSGLHHQEQAGSLEPETVVQGRKPEKKGRGRPKNCNRGTKEGQESGETNKKPNNGQGRQKKQQDVNKEGSAVLHEPDHKLEETEHIMDDCLDKSQTEAHDTLEWKQAMPSEPVTDLDSQKQTKQLRMDGLGKTMEEKETSMEDVADSSNLYALEQNGVFDQATNQHSQHQIKPEDDAQGRPLEHLLEDKNVVTFTTDLHQQQQAASSEPETVVQGRQEKRDQVRPRKRNRGTKEGQESEETKKKPNKVRRGRPRKQQDVNKEDSAVLLEPAHKLEEIEHVMDDYPDKSQSEAHDTLERKQAIPSSDDDIHQRKEQSLDGRDQTDKQQEELKCHEIEVKQGKSEVESQVRRRKEKSRKSNAIQVPLSSKDQLRSRIKHQSQNRTRR